MIKNFLDEQGHQGTGMFGREVGPGLHLLVAFARTCQVCQVARLCSITVTM